MEMNQAQPRSLNEVGGWLSHGTDSRRQQAEVASL